MKWSKKLLAKKEVYTAEVKFADQTLTETEIKDVEKAESKHMSYDTFKIFLIRKLAAGFFMIIGVAIIVLSFFPILLQEYPIVFTLMELYSIVIVLPSIFILLFTSLRSPLRNPSIFSKILKTQEDREVGIKIINITGLGILLLLVYALFAQGSTGVQQFLLIDKTFSLVSLFAATLSIAWGIQLF